ncbi:uncharacterized protein L201_005232 [Kwoniella dendrophila CBS 6074]|uniref:Uncharacterized protein n=1 Tax=Kwoniella dendrophila CBS 6074 TaxID=1295534 RepID=A0AAX4JYN1_9TREE
MNTTQQAHTASFASTLDDDFESDPREFYGGRRVPKDCFEEAQERLSTKSGSSNDEAVSNLRLPYEAIVLQSEHDDSSHSAGDTGDEAYLAATKTDGDGNKSEILFRKRRGSDIIERVNSDGTTTVVDSDSSF